MDEDRSTIHGVTGKEVDTAAKVNPSAGRIIELWVEVKVAFGLEHP